jgi:phage I-like protein
MNQLPTRTGGDRNRSGGNLALPVAIHTAGAPAISHLAAAALPVGTHPRGEGERGRIAPAAIEADRGDQVRHASSSAGASTWIELLPAGVFYGRDGRGPFRLDDPAAVIAATQALRMEAGIPIDYDHATDLAAPEGRPAPAAGWIRELQARDGALWGRVEWTARALSAIGAREYRYISPVFQFEPEGGRVTRLLRAALTNNPNLYLTAIAAASDAVAAKDGTMDEFLEELRELLGLKPDAAPDEIVARVREQCAAADNRDGGDGGGAAMSARGGGADPARYVAIAEYQRALTELNGLRAERTHQRAAHAVEDAIRAGRLTPAQREWATAYAAADFDGFAAFIAKQPAILAGGAEPLSRPEPAGAAAPLTTVENAVCVHLGLRHSDYLRRKHGRADFLRFERGVEQGTGR